MQGVGTQRDCAFCLAPSHPTHLQPHEHDERGVALSPRTAQLPGEKLLLPAPSPPPPPPHLPPHVHDECGVALGPRTAQLPRKQLLPPSPSPPPAAPCTR